LDDPEAEKHIRLYNALNAPTFNAETRKMMEEDDMCLITVGTDTMSVGVDLRTPLTSGAVVAPTSTHSAFLSADLRDATA
jgi:Rad3-related DNA helicase